MIQSERRKVDPGLLAENVGVSLDGAVHGGWWLTSHVPD